MYLSVCTCIEWFPAILLILQFDFANFINSDMKPEDSRSMCCRVRIDNRELIKRGGGLFGANPLTGSRNAY